MGIYDCDTYSCKGADEVVSLSPKRASGTGRPLMP
jgi:hypothetical protein